MTAKTARVTINADRVSPAAAVRQAAQAGPLLVLTARLVADLAEELGGMDAAVSHLLEVAEQAGCPIGVNVPAADGSRTCFIGPRSWTQERLQGYVGGRHAEIEAEFGEVARTSPLVQGPEGAPP